MLFLCKPCNTGTNQASSKRRPALGTALRLITMQCGCAYFTMCIFHTCTDKTTTKCNRAAHVNMFTDTFSSDHLSSNNRSAQLNNGLCAQVVWFYTANTLFPGILNGVHWHRRAAIIKNSTLFEFACRGSRACDVRLFKRNVALTKRRCDLRPRDGCASPRIRVSICYVQSLYTHTHTDTTREQPTHIGLHAVCASRIIWLL